MTFSLINIYLRFSYPNGFLWIHNSWNINIVFHHNSFVGLTVFPFTVICNHIKPFPSLLNYSPGFLYSTIELELNCLFDSLGCFSSAAHSISAFLSFHQRFWCIEISRGSISAQCWTEKRKKYLKKKKERKKEERKKSLIK